MVSSRERIDFLVDMNCASLRSDLTDAGIFPVQYLLNTVYVSDELLQAQFILILQRSCLINSAMACGGVGYRVRARRIVQGKSPSDL